VKRLQELRASQRACCAFRPYEPNVLALKEVIQRRSDDHAPSAFSRPDPHRHDVLRRCRPLANAGFAPTAVDPRGLTQLGDEAIAIQSLSDDPHVDYGTSRGFNNDLLMAQESLIALAQETGGLAIVRTNDLAGGLTRVERDTSRYYVLGYSSGPSKSPGRFRRIEVKVDPDEALSILANPPAPISLLLTDVVMPNMSGRELARICHAQHPELRVLYMSGYPNGAVGEDGLLEPGLAFIQKPFAGPALLQRVRAVLDTPAPHGV
jgi:CheY-like chemotaxis protein